MTVFIASAEADAATADALAQALKNRAHLVERESPMGPHKPIQSLDAVVVLWSQAATMSPHRVRLEARALEAWAEERLILVALDKGFLPLALRDLPAIDATFEARRDFTWGEISDAARALAHPLQLERYTELRPALDEDEAPPRGGVVASPKKGGGGALLWIGLTVAVLLAALQAIAVFAPGLVAIFNPMAGGGSASPSDGLVPLGMIAGLAILFAALLLLANRRSPKQAAAKPDVVAARSSPAAWAESIFFNARIEPPIRDPVFVSYASADAAAVLPQVEAVESEGLPIWIDRKGLRTGEGWAGEIVAAIRKARRVLVMCSARSFESPHVLREVYLAARFNKPLVPVFLEEAEPPDDFLYHFANVQWLKLYAVPESDRPSAIVAAAA